MPFQQQQSLSPVKRALLAIEQLQQQLKNQELARTEPIAIVGMGCRFPGGSTSPASFWQLLYEGRDAITPVPPDRWQPEPATHPHSSSLHATRDRLATTEGGFLGGIDRFDADFFCLSPREARSLDPQQRLLLTVSWEALENAGIVPEHLFKSPTGVFVGIGTCDYAKRLDRAQAFNAYTGTGTSLSVAAGRISYVLGLTGPSLAVDTACSSSLVTVHLACQSLRHQECNLALAGGVNLMLSPDTSLIFSEAGMMSPDGRCKTFDDRANGYVRSEGCGVVVLKRLSDALRDKNPILAVIRGSAINQDGPSGGLTIPNGPAQVAVIRAALAQGQVDPAQVSYVETHGTGTSLGDPIEVRALQEVFAAHHGAADPLTLGSVKTNIGHTECAAGMAGLMKVVLQLQHQTLAPHLHFQTPNAHIDWAHLPFQIPTQSQPWESPNSPPADPSPQQPSQAAHPRIAGVSSFGFSGTNAHVVLAEFLTLPAAPTGITVPPDRSSDHRPPTHASTHPSPHLLTLAAKTETALMTLVQRYQDYLGSMPDESFSNICLSSQLGRSHFKHRLAVVSPSRQDCLATLQQVLAGKTSARVWTGQDVSQTSPLPVLPDSLDVTEWAQLYAQGMTLDWPQIHRDRIWQWVPLPTYPFEEQRYWVEAESATQVDAITTSSNGPIAAPLAAPQHPLLGDRLPLPFASQIRFAANLSIHQPLHQNHHRLYGLNVLAAASYVSLLLTAVQGSLGRPGQGALGTGTETGEAVPCELQDLMFLQVLVLADTATRSLQVILEREDTDTQASLDGASHTPPIVAEAVYALQVISRAAPSQTESPAMVSEADWVRHVQGRAGVLPVPVLHQASLVDRAELQQRCPRVLTKAQIYANLTEAGYTLGTAFQWIDQVWQGEGEAIAQLSQPDLPDAVVDYSLYPGLIDSCFQLLGGCLSATEWASLNTQGEIFVPFRIQRVQFFRSPVDQKLWCHVHRRDQSQPAATSQQVATAASPFATNAEEINVPPNTPLNAPHSISGDLVIFDHTGAVIAKILGYEVRKAKRQGLQQALQQSLPSQREQVFYHLGWQPQPWLSPLPDPAIAPPGSWLVLVPNLAIGQALIAALHPWNQHCALVLPATGINPTASPQKPTEEAPDELPFHVLHPLDQAGWQQRLQQIQANHPPFQGILHLWSLALPSKMGDRQQQGSTAPDLTPEFPPTETGANALDRAQELTCASTLTLLQALPPELTGISLWLVTQGAQAVTVEPDSPEYINPHQAPLWGLGRTITHEWSHLACHCLDLDPQLAWDERGVASGDPAIREPAIAGLQSLIQSLIQEVVRQLPQSESAANPGPQPPVNAPQPPETQIAYRQ